MPEPSDPLAAYASGPAPRARDWDRPLRGSAGTDGSYDAWLTGSGSPVVQADRSGPSVTVRAGGEVVVVDCGAGTGQRLAALGIGLGDVSVLAITHLHIDHVVELAWLALCPLKPSRPTPLRIEGPTGTREFVDRTLSAYHLDCLFRETMGFDPDRLVPQVTEVDDGAEFGGGAWTALAFEVDHRPVWPALGYRLDLGGQIVVISGDTRPCVGVSTHARGADVLVHEAIWPGWGYEQYHTTPRDLGRLAADAEVGHLVLTHLIPGHLPDHVWLDEVAVSFDGRCTVGTDLMPLLDQPSGKAEPW